MPYTEPRERGDFVIFLILSRRLALCVMALACVAPAGVFDPAPARAADAVSRESPSAAEPASHDPAVSDVRAALPRILSDGDVVLYRRIFALQVGGQWKAADRLVARLTDPLLMGHVRAQRYLHPTKYRTRYKELKAWMAKYADHPDAGRLYKLALKRKPKNWLAPKPPVRGYLYGNGRYAAGLPGPPPRRGLTRDQRRKVVSYKRRLRRLLRSGWTKAAKRLLETKELRRLFSTAEYDQARGQLGARYFADGRDEWALRWAGEAADRSGRYITEAHWTAGLAAWRLRRYDDAGRHFEAVAALNAGSPWMISAAAFWAARTHLVNRRPENVNRWLGVAGAYPRTFYGLLARRMLGLPMPFRWTVPPSVDRDFVFDGEFVRVYAVIDADDQIAEIHEDNNKGWNALQISGVMVTSAPASELHVVPNEFELFEAFPNPFNPSTQIQYALPEHSLVRLSVYDVQGRRVAILVNATQPAGKHTVSFDAKNLATGVYFYRLTAGAFQQTKKILLVK